ncbi:hypothetical protein GCM10017556_12970 [Micromonospora sagamiensis]|uniref:DNA-binding transcriptional regulator of glucitol operon n=2 Tax=Micromonospora sagamiensis TaxID=47875 RepID=A0A562WC80_9ACTN|nr:hypothetical protein JD81_01047 [Micromonospora sagamiensis]BCL13558.1 hypothetical protein GCM10017556_12970 [Micromonospora sagamiensis]
MPTPEGTKPPTPARDYDVASETPGRPGTLGAMKRLWTPAWILRHVAMVVLVVGFCALGWWQISRAAAGNTLSWAYAVEWPIFAAFVVFVWWREVRHTLRGEPAPDDPPAGTPPSDRPVVPLATIPGTGAAAAAAPPSGTPGTPVVRRPVRVVRATVPAGDGEDADLTEYNRYLTWLNANPGARPGDYPG